MTKALSNFGQVGIFLVIICLASCAKHIDISKPTSIEDGNYVVDHEKSYIDDMYKIFLSDVSTYDQRKGMLEYAAGMKSRKSLGLLMLGLCDKDSDIRADALAMLESRCQLGNDPNKSEIEDLIKKLKRG